jgi:hypothetical protein
LLAHGLMGSDTFGDLHARFYGPDIKFISAREPKLHPPINTSFFMVDEEFSSRSILIILVTMACNALGSRVVGRL